MNGKIIVCGSDYNDHLKIKLRKRKKKLTREWWMKDWLQDKEEWKRIGRKLHLQFGHGNGKAG